MDQELVQYLDERFGRIEQRLDGHDRRFEGINQRFESIDQRFDGIDRRFNEIDHRFDDVNERIRHNGVLIEGVRHEVQLVAEALTMHIQVQHVQEREYHDRQHQETRALLHLSYEQLHQRVENLERNRPN